MYKVFQLPEQSLVPLWRNALPVYCHIIFASKGTFNGLWLLSYQIGVDEPGMGEVVVEGRELRDWAIGGPLGNWVLTILTSVEEMPVEEIEEPTWAEGGKRLDHSPPLTPPPEKKRKKNYTGVRPWKAPASTISSLNRARLNGKTSAGLRSWTSWFPKISPLVNCMVWGWLGAMGNKFWAENNQWPRSCRGEGALQPTWRGVKCPPPHRVPALPPR